MPDLEPLTRGGSEDNTRLGGANTSPTKPPQEGTPLYRVHVFRGRGQWARQATHGPLDAEKSIVLAGQVLGNPRTERVVFVRVRE